jgi:hypothetical protein
LSAYCATGAVDTGWRGKVVALIFTWIQRCVPLKAPSQARLMLNRPSTIGQPVSAIGDPNWVPPVSASHSENSRLKLPFAGWPLCSR